ncbi:MAG: hypothetical protein HY046_14800 [Acidobacteria bacterium]|nr:hypothetical protein [Acidobacteriota bacterium]
MALRNWKRKLLFLGIALAAAYVGVSAGLYAAMLQPPDTFGQIMARMPGPAFMVLPFEPLWMRARAGTLQLGDAAPDFSLQSSDKKLHVQLTSFRGKKPVVLVFGSYT